MIFYCIKSHPTHDEDAAAAVSTVGFEFKSRSQRDRTKLRNVEAKRDRKRQLASIFKRVISVSAYLFIIISLNLIKRKKDRESDREREREREREGGRRAERATQSGRERISGVIMTDRKATAARLNQPLIT